MGLPVDNYIQATVCANAKGIVICTKRLVGILM